MADAPKLRTMTIEEQVKSDVWYELVLRFVLDVGLKEVNDIMDKLGVPDKMFAKDAAVVRITQTTPFIPDEETIKKLKEIITDGYNNSDSKLDVHSIRFDGFESIKVLTPQKGE